MRQCLGCAGHLRLQAGLYDIMKPSLYRKPSEIIQFAREIVSLTRRGRGGGGGGGGSAVTSGLWTRLQVGVSVFIDKGCH